MLEVIEKKPTRIQELAEKQDIIALKRNDIIEIQGEEYLYRVHYNDLPSQEIDLVGRSGEKSVQWIEAKYSGIQVQEGMFKLLQGKSSIFPERKNSVSVYSFSKKMLQELGIWERE